MMDQDDDRHLFDLIINPAIGGLTTIAAPIAILLSGISILQGRFLFAFPLIMLILLGGIDVVLFIVRLIAANVGRPRSNSYHRYAFHLLVLTLFLSIAVILFAFYSGTVRFGPDVGETRTSSQLCRACGRDLPG